MRSHSWEQPVVLIAALAALLWIGGIALYLGANGRELQRVGLLLAITAGTTTALGVLRSWQLRMHRAFVHGYHAGFHDGTGSLRPSYAKDCDVLEFSEVQARRLAQLG